MDSQASLENVEIVDNYADQGGGIWLQAGGGPARNPFFGSMMLECHSERFALPTTGGDSQ